MGLIAPGFLVVYRWQVDPSHEAAFIARWQSATERLAALGSQGSLLGRSVDGEMVAVALWPSAEARDRIFASMTDEAPWPPCTMRETILIDPIKNLWGTNNDDKNA